MTDDLEQRLRALLAEKAEDAGAPPAMEPSVLRRARARRTTTVSTWAASLTLVAVSAVAVMQIPSGEILPLPPADPPSARPAPTGRPTPAPAPPGEPPAFAPPATAPQGVRLLRERSARTAMLKIKGVGLVEGMRDGAWVSSTNERGQAVLMRIDSRSNSVVGQVTLEPPKKHRYDQDSLRVTALEIDGSRLWVLVSWESRIVCSGWCEEEETDDFPDYVLRLDARSGAIRDRRLIGGDLNDMAVARGALWILDRKEGDLLRVDPETLRIKKRSGVGDGPTSVSYSAGSLWVTAWGTRRVYKVDADVGNVLRATGGFCFPVSVAGDGRSVWVTDRHRNALIQLSTSGDVLRRVGTESEPGRMESAFGSLWVASHGGNEVTRLDAGNGRPQEAMHVPRPGSLSIGGPSVWVTYRRGLETGVARIDIGSRPGRLPAKPYEHTPCPSS